MRTCSNFDFDRKDAEKINFIEMIITENDGDKVNVPGSVTPCRLMLMDVKLLDDESTEMMEFMDKFLHFFTQSKLIFQAPQQH